MSKNLVLTHEPDDVQSQTDCKILIFAPPFISQEGEFPFTMLYLSDDNIASRAAKALKVHRWSAENILKLLTGSVFVGFPRHLPLDEAGKIYTFHCPYDAELFWKLLGHDHQSPKEAYDHFVRWGVREFVRLGEHIRNGRAVIDSSEDNRIFWVLQGHPYAEVYNALSNLY